MKKIIYLGDELIAPDLNTEARVSALQPSGKWSDPFLWKGGLIWPKPSGGGSIDVDVRKLLNAAPTFVARGKTNMGTKVYIVDHPLKDLEGAEIVLMHYAKKNGKKRGSSSSSRGPAKKGYCVACGSRSRSTGAYFVFSGETTHDQLYDFFDELGRHSFSGHFGIALRIPNPEWTRAATLHKNAIYKGIPESLWSDVLPVCVSYDGEHDNFGIGLI